MTDIIQLSPTLASISARSALVTSIRSTLQAAFGDDLPSLKGNISLITEILIAIESMKHKLKSEEEKDRLFMDVYMSVFGPVQSGIESNLLNGIVSHLRERGAVYRRTRIGNLIRAILRVFRA